MSGSVSQLIRAGFVTPRLAVQQLLGRNLSHSAVFQGAVLLAILNAISFFFFVDLMMKISPEAMVFVTPPLLISVLEQLIFIGIYAVVTVTLSPAVGKKPTLVDAVIVFVWFNILQLGAVVSALLVVLLVGPLGFLLVFAPFVWTVWAIGQYWAELVENESSLVGFLFAAVVFVISLSLLGIVARLLNLPGTEVITNV